MKLINQRVSNIRRFLKEENLEAVLITKPENIYYLSYFSGSSACLLITDQFSFLFTDFRYLEQASTQSPLFKVKKSENGLIDAVSNEIIRLKHIKTVGFEARHLTYAQYKKIEGKLKQHNIILKPLEEPVETLRLKKDQAEIRNISYAAEIGLLALEDCKPLIKPGITEKALATELEHSLKKRGADKSAFDIIVASGKRSALPHGVATDKKIEDGDLVVIDWGCQVNGYHSDCTRTFFVGKGIDKKWYEIYEIVETAQQRAISAVFPGKKIIEVDNKARNYIKDKGYGAYFGHGLGHGVGLEVHEAPTISPKGKGVLEAGMVIAIEPGIYLPGEGGVRLEELVLVTEKGPKILTSLS